MTQDLNLPSFPTSLTYEFQPHFYSSPSARIGVDGREREKSTQQIINPHPSINSSFFSIRNSDAHRKTPATSPKDIHTHKV